MQHGHRVLGGVAVAQPGAAAHLDEAGKAGKLHVYLALIQRPDIDERVHALIGRVDLQRRTFFVPVVAQGRQCRVPGGGRRIFFADAHAFGPRPLPQEKRFAQDLAGREDKTPVQRRALVAAQLRAAGKRAPLHADGVCLGAVRADERLPHRIVAVRRESGRKILEAVLLIEKVLFDDAVRIATARGIQAHLKVAVVHIDMVERQLGVAEHADVPRPAGDILQRKVPDLHSLAPGNEQRLHGADAAVLTFVFCIGQAVAAGIFRPVQRLAHGLPRNRPVLPGVVVPKINVMAGPVHGHGVGAKTRDAVIFGAFMEQVSARRVVHHGAHLLRAKIIGPARGQVHPVDDIFPAVVVEVAVLHTASSLYGPRGGRARCRCFYCTARGAR